ncbi:MAG: hydrogenase [Desulfovibrionaceae bacterium]|jgi:hydrogenase-4 component E|nr:hydrogenase [Desulfovibrionaceae bacterium]
MDTVTDALLLAVILINFYALGTSRLLACIKAAALQGALLALLPLTMHGLAWHTLVLGAEALLFKGVCIPLLLRHAIRETRIRRELEPLIGYVPTQALGVLLTACSFVFAERLPLAAAQHAFLLVPTALATMFAGFLLLTTRRKAITQVVGYLVLENGIFLFGVLLSRAMPFMVEAGVLLDLLVGVFVMGIVMRQIGREFSTLNTRRLSALKE